MTPKSLILKLGLSLLVLFLTFSSGVWVANKYRDSLELERLQTVEAAAQAFDERLVARQEQLRPIHKTIQAETKEIIREEVRYSECVNDTTVIGLLDAARANRGTGDGEASVP